MLKKLFGKAEIVTVAIACCAVAILAIEEGARAQAPLNPALTAPHSTPTAANGTLTAGSTDYGGSLSATATSGVAVTFSVPFNNTPFCIVKDRTTASGDLLTAFSKTGFTMGTTVSADNITWICQPAVGG